MHGLSTRWAEQAAGDAFGTAPDQGAVFRQRLLPSAVAPRKPDHHLLPMPRGSMAGLRLVPLERAQPGPGEVKVRDLRPPGVPPGVPEQAAVHWPAHNPTPHLHPHAAILARLPCLDSSLARMVG